MNDKNEQKLNIPTLGMLTLHDVLDFYDIPLVFVTKDIFDTLYLFLVTIHNKEQTEWLVTKISKNRYLELKYNKITLQSAYKNPETEKYFLVSDFNNGKTTIRECDSLPDDKITDYEHYVGEDVEIDADAYDTLENARKTHKNTVDIITKNQYNEFGMDGKQLRDTLDATIGLLGIYNIPPFNVKMLPKSTVLRFEFKDDFNLLDPLSSTEPLEKFSKLLSLSAEEQISNNLKHNIKYLEKYDVFLKNVGKNTTTLIQIASPNDTSVRQIHMNVNDINTRRANVRKIVETRNHEFDDDFYCFSFDTKKMKVGFIFDDMHIYADIKGTDINPSQETGKTYRLKGIFKVKIVDDQINKTDFKVTFLEKKD